MKTDSSLAERAPDAPGPTGLIRRTLPLQAQARGVLLCGVIALAASFIAQVHGGPQLLYALLFGVGFHFLYDNAQIRPGIDVCTGWILRLGVALLGVRITLAQIAALGWTSAAVVVVAMLSTIAAGIWLARRLGLRGREGLLSGAATGICGASAALAIAAVLPRSREQERFTLLVVVAVTSLSTVAMLVYPLLVHALNLTPAQAGLFIGGSIHDVAQVVGAGYLLGPQTGDAATVVKLFRVSLLAAVVVAVSLAFRQESARQAGPADTRRPALVPWFLWLFAALVALNSMHAVPALLQTAAQSLSRDCLVLAIAGLGVKTSFQTLVAMGWRPFVLLLAETLWLAGALLASIWAVQH